MKIAIVAGGFTPSEADQLRRAMATFRHVGTIHTFEEKLINGMITNGYDPDFARRCFDQIRGFGEYGFPESHAASFALLVYVSSWLKKHYPDVFTAALLNSQPMGFYAPAQLVRDAKEHGVKVRPVDVNFSKWDNTLEPNGTGSRALRLGLRQVKGLSKSRASTLIASRDQPFGNLSDLYLRTRLSAATLECLARADGYGSMELGRREALWAVRALPPAPLPLFKAGEYRNDPKVSLPTMSIGEEVTHDYSALRLSLKKHPLALLRKELNITCVTPTKQLLHTRDGTQVTVAGLALIRQRPGTASGVIFITLEDETGVANLVVWPKTFERFRRIVMGAQLIRATGKLQREGTVTHVIINRMEDLTHRLHALGGPDFEPLVRKHTVETTRENGPAYTDRTRNPINDARKPLTCRTFPSRDFH